MRSLRWETGYCLITKTNLSDREQDHDWIPIQLCLTSWWIQVNYSSSRHLVSLGLTMMYIFSETTYLQEIYSLNPLRVERDCSKLKVTFSWSAFLLMWRYLWCTLAAHPTGIIQASLSDAWTVCSDCYDSNINMNDVGNYKLLSNPRPLWFSPVLFLSWTSRQQ